MQQAKIILLMSAGLMLESAAAAIDPKVVIPARQAGMKQIGQNFKTINDQLRSGSADIAVVRARAASWPFSPPELRAGSRPAPGPTRA